MDGTEIRAKAAAISLKPRKWDKPHNADKLEELFRKAARTRAQLLVATEGALDGYVVMEVIRKPNKKKAMLDLAEPIDGPYIKRFQKLARSLQRCLAFGFAERVGRNIFNAAILIDHHGCICGKYRKTQLAEGCHPSWRFNRIGNKLRAFDTPFGRAGFLICNDRWNPNIARAIVLDGARYLMICSYGDRSRQQNITVLSRARENGVPIIEANVGVNLVVNRGEIAAYKWGNDQITTAQIDIPLANSPSAARAVERAFLKWQGPEMRNRYRVTMKKVRKTRTG